MLPRTKHFKPRRRRKRGKYAALALVPVAFATYYWGAVILDKVKESYQGASDKIEKIQKNKECYDLGVENGGLYANFRGDEFGFEKRKPKAGLNATLYHLNDEKNPDLKIKGDKLARLKDLFALVRNNDVANKALEGMVTEAPGKNYCNSPVKSPASLLAGSDYWFPFYIQ